MSDLEDDYSSEGDDDYVPSGEASEGDSDDGDAAGQESGDEEVTGKIKADAKTKKKKLKKKANEATRKRKGGIQLEGDDGEENDANDSTTAKNEEQLADALSKEEQTKKKEEAEKRRADDLWSSFLKDVGPPKKAKTSAPGSSTSQAVNSVTASNKASEAKSQSTDKSAAPQESKKKEMVTVTKVFDFAGEKVQVEEKVSADSKEAKMMAKKEDTPSTSVIKKTPAGLSVGGLKRPGGLSSVLGQIGKKSKISTLEKSKLDWNRFKSQEGIEEEVSAFVKSKSGYVEKQNFLARTDQRQYEKERDLRLSQQKILR